MTGSHHILFGRLLLPYCVMDANTTCWANELAGFTLLRTDFEVSCRRWNSGYRSLAGVLAVSKHLFARSQCVALTESYEYSAEHG